MNVTKSQLISKISEKSGFYQKDVKKVLECLDDVVFDCLCEVTDDEEISVQVIQGAKISVRVVPSRERVDPRTQEPIIVKPTIKPACKFSMDFRKAMQERYDSKNDG